MPSGTSDWKMRRRRRPSPDVSASSSYSSATPARSASRRSASASPAGVVMSADADSFTRAARNPASARDPTCRSSSNRRCPSTSAVACGRPRAERLGGRCQQQRAIGGASRQELALDLGQERREVGSAHPVRRHRRRHDARESQLADGPRHGARESRGVRDRREVGQRAAADRREDRARGHGFRAKRRAGQPSGRRQRVQRKPRGQLRHAEAMPPAGRADARQCVACEVIGGAAGGRDDERGVKRGGVVEKSRRVRESQRAAGGRDESNPGDFVAGRHAGPPCSGAVGGAVGAL